MVNASDLMKKEFVRLDVNDTISRFVGVILNQKEHYALLFSGNTYVGYADKKGLIRTKIDPDSMKLKNILKHAPKLSPGMDLKEIARLFLAGDVRALPVIDKNKVIGVVKETALLPEIIPFLKNSSIKELIRGKKLITFFDQDPVGLVINKMKDKNVDRAPIITLRGKLAGIITYIDLFSKFYIWPLCNVERTRSKRGIGKGKGSGHKDKESAGKVPVENYMTPLCISCNCNEDLQAAAKKMIEKDVTSIVILEEGRPVGIITVTDLLRKFLL